MNKYNFKGRNNVAAFKSPKEISIKQAVAS
jgi:hypothetical protein